MTRLAGVVFVVLSAILVLVPGSGTGVVAIGVLTAALAANSALAVTPLNGGTAGGATITINNGAGEQLAEPRLACHRRKGEGAMSMSILYGFGVLIRARRANRRMRRDRGRRGQ